MESTEGNLRILMMGFLQEPLLHLCRCSFGKSQHQNGGRRYLTGCDEIKNALYNNKGFAAAGACQHLTGPGTVTNCLLLKRIGAG